MTSCSPGGSRSASDRVVEQLVEAPGVVSVDRVLNLCLLGEQRVEVGLRVGEARRNVVEAVEQVSEGTDAVLDVPTDVLRLVELRLLRQQADASRRVRARRLPEDGSSSPAMIRSSVDLPAPFGPKTPIFAPGRKEREMLASTCRSGP